MKIFVDTNVLLRFFLEEQGEQFQSSKRLITQIEEGIHQAQTSSIVFLEVSYVLKSIYKIPSREIVEVLKSIRSLKNLKVIEKTNLDRALQLHSKYNVKFSDCLIASQIPENTVLITFDKEFNKIPGIKAKTP